LALVFLNKRFIYLCLSHSAIFVDSIERINQLQTYSQLCYIGKDGVFKTNTPMTTSCSFKLAVSSSVLATVSSAFVGDSATQKSSVKSTLTRTWSTVLQTLSLHDVGEVLLLPHACDYNVGSHTVNLLSAQVTTPMNNNQSYQRWHTHTHTHTHTCSSVAVPLTAAAGESIADIAWHHGCHRRSTA
jgi:hypothetical protein